MSWAALLLFSMISTVSTANEAADEQVVLLHGLCRTSRSMEPMRRGLEQAGYRVRNIDYDSRAGKVETISDRVIGAVMEECRRDGARKIHFVAHSLGGILVRSYFSRHDASLVGRVVMLGPPNQGSEIVDRLGSWRLFLLINGPAGCQLGTKEGAIPGQLGAPNFEAGVIAGNRSINWINSVLIPGPDDGKVSVERTRLDGMTDHLVVRAAHPWLMRKREVIEQTIYFLRHGSFDKAFKPALAGKQG